MINRTIGRQYHILRQLGAGGMGEVYLARHLVLQRDAAVKVLKAEYTQTPDFLARFQREGQALAKLSHPNVVAVYDAGVDQGLYYIAMEYVQGHSVRQLLAQQGPLPPDRAVHIAAQVADVLEFAHQRGMLHRDIKPANIMLTTDDVVKVTDFGVVAMLTGQQVAHTRIGTPAYMAYEHFNGAAERRSDIYSLGVTLYEMVTGQLPPAFGLQPPTPPTQLNPQVSPALEQVIYRALQMDPNKRPQSAARFRMELERIREKIPRALGPINEIRIRRGEESYVALRATATMQLAQMPGATLHFAWSSDGNKLVYLDERGGKINVRVAEGFAYGRIKTTTICEMPKGFKELLWSRDGTRIIYGWTNDLSAWKAIDYHARPPRLVRHGEKLNSSWLKWAAR